MTVCLCICGLPAKTAQITAVYTSNCQAKAPKSPNLGETLRHFAHHIVITSLSAMDGHGMSWHPMAPLRHGLRSGRRTTSLVRKWRPPAGSRPGQRTKPAKKLGVRSGLPELPGLPGLPGLLTMLTMLTMLTISPSRGLRSSILICCMPGQILRATSQATSLLMQTVMPTSYCCSASLTIHN